MPVETRDILVTAKEDCGIVDITKMVSEEVGNSRIMNGTVTVFCIGSTGAITTMEFEPNLSKDVAETLNELVPLNKDYHHHKTWGDFNGGSHLRALFIGPSLMVPFVEKKVDTWDLAADRLHKL